MYLYSQLVRDVRIYTSIPSQVGSHKFFSGGEGARVPGKFMFARRVQGQFFAALLCCIVICKVRIFQKGPGRPGSDYLTTPYLDPRMHQVVPDRGEWPWHAWLQQSMHWAYSGWRKCVAKDYPANYTNSKLYACKMADILLIMHI